MDLIKKNIVSVVCGVVAIICIVVVFFPFGGMFSSLQDDVRGGWQVGTDLQNLTRVNRTWPSLSDREEDKLPLDQFPTGPLIAMGNKMTDDWKTDSKQFLDYVVADQNAQLKPLVPGTLPTVQNTPVGLRFISEYQKRFGVYVLSKGVVDQSNSLLTQVLDSTTPPSEVDVKKKQDEKTLETQRKFTIYQEGQVTNAEEVQGLVATAIADMATQMRTASATEHLMYADPLTVLDVNPKIAGTVPPSENDVFVAQVTLWVQEQICLAIRATNDAAHQSQPKPAAGVLGSPIKRLLRVQVEHQFVPLPPVPGAPAETPVLPSNPQAKITPNFMTAPFGHIANEFYQPVKFDVTMVVDANSITQILTELTRNRYFIFRNVQVQSMDSSIDAAQGFLYGDVPVVQLRIRGNYLFLREVLKQYMPVDIIRGLTLPAGAEGQAQGMPGMDGL